MSNSKVIDCNSPNSQRLRKPKVLAKLTFGGFKAALVVLSSRAFSRLPECPYQRNHVLRAETVRYLETASPIHTLVLMTSVDGELRKLDGHTRSQKWENGTLAQPPSILGMVIYCDDYDQVQGLYHQVDNRAAAKSIKEVMTSTWRSLGFVPTSEFFQKGSFKSATNAAFSGLSRYLPAAELALISQQAVDLLDRMDAGLKHNSKRKIHPMVVAAALVGVQKLVSERKESRLAEVGEFLQLVLEGVVNIDGHTGTRDAVTLLLNVLEDQTIPRSKARQEQIYYSALGSLQLWLDSAAPRYDVSELVPMDQFAFLGIADPMAVVTKKPKAVRRQTKLTNKALERLQDKAPAVASVEAAPVMSSTPKRKVVNQAETFAATLDKPSLQVEIRPLIKPNLSRVFAKS